MWENTVFFLNMRHRNVLSDYTLVQPQLPMVASEPRALFIHQTVRKICIRGRKVYTTANTTLQLSTLQLHSRDHASLPCISIEAHQAGYKTSDNMILQASKASQMSSANIKEVQTIPQFRGRWRLGKIFENPCQGNVVGVNLSASGLVSIKAATALISRVLVYALLALLQWQKWRRRGEKRWGKKKRKDRRGLSIWAVEKRTRTLC